MLEVLAEPIRRVPELPGALCHLEKTNQTLLRQA